MRLNQFTEKNLPGHIAKHKEPDRADQVIQNWMRNRNTVEFLGVWERLNNPDFNPSNSRGLEVGRD